MYLSSQPMATATCGVTSARLAEPTDRASVDRPAICLIDSDRRILLATPAALAQFHNEKALVLRHGVVSACSQFDAARLAAAFRAIAAEAGTMRVFSLGEDDALVEVQLVRLEGEGRATQILMTLRTPSEAPRRQLQLVARRFDLTQAEERLLGALCMGLSLAEAALRLGVARTTVRTHLQRIFDKSNTHRQAELVRLVFAA